MENETNEKTIGIGNKEAATLEAATVGIVEATIEPVKIKGDKEKKKVSCSVKHPNREDPVKISAVKYERKGQLRTDGLWLNLDEDGLIVKGSALAVFLQYLAVQNIEGLHGKEVDTVVDDKGYLCFKAY